MNIKFNMTEEMYKQYIETVYLSSWPAKFIFGLLNYGLGFIEIVVGIVILVSTKNSNYALVVCIGFIIYMFLPKKKFLGKFIFKRHMKKGTVTQDFFTEHEFEILNDRFVLTYGDKRDELLHSEKFRLITSKELIAIRTVSRTFCMIPASAFASEGLRNNFIAGVNTILFADWQDVDDVKSEDLVMSVTYSFDKETLLDASVNCLRKSFTTRFFWNNRRIIFLLVSIALIGLLVFWVSKVQMNTRVLAILIALIFGLNFDLIILFTPILRNSQRNSIYNTPILLLERCMDIYTDRCVLKDENSSSTYRYSRMYCYKQDEKMIYVYTKYNVCMIIPKSAFTNIHDLERFFNILDNIG